MRHSSLESMVIRAGKVFAVACVTLCFMLVNVVLPVYADKLPAAERKAVEEFPNWVGLCGSATGESAGGPTDPGNVYIIGDSITAIAKETYEKKFTEGEWTPTISGLGSRHIKGEPPSPDGISQIQLPADKEAIKKAKAIVVALGTNDSGNSASAIQKNVKAFMDQLQSLNIRSAKVYWVNIIDTRSDSDSKKTNQAIADGIESEAAVIDWYTAADDGAALSTFEGGVHPTRQKDIDLLVNTVYTAVNGNGAKSASPEGSCTCSADGGSDTLTGKDNPEKTWNFFKAKGLSDEQVAGIMANIKQESDFDPQIMQKGGRSKDPYDAGFGGWGLIQWSDPASKVIGLLKQSGVSGPIYELSTQLELTWQHMQNHPVVTQPFDLKHFKTIKDPLEAAIYFGVKIEGFSEAGARYDYVDDMLNKYKGKSGGVGSGSSGCSGNAGSPDCASASGNAKILCEAKKYDVVNYVWGGGHGGGITYHKACSDPKANSSECGLDCSGLIGVAIYDAFGTNGKASWTTYAMMDDKANWKIIPFSEAKPGDAVLPNSGHVEIVDHIEGQTVYTFGAHSASRPQPDQVGPTKMTNSGGYVYVRYVGPGGE